ncbi:MAG TPA: peptidase U32 family protein [Ignavibacteriaceae bacterium]|nr:peptidase U32 family protein [Ignavibacteriaceae bacterium]
MKKPELMAPAGNWTMLRAVVKAGANAVYFGTDQLNMRAKAKNFHLENLPEIVEYCNANNVKTYLTINTIIYESEIDEAYELIGKAKAAGIDMIICWDLSIIQLCNKLNMPFAVSTQASVSNSASAEMYKNLGAKRVVLARECYLEDVKKIKSKVDIEIEAFIHGAMCIAVSGRCFMSHEMFGKSANRGECIQPCRREYEIIDKSTDKSMILGEDYVLSPEDLCSVEFIDQLIEAGIDSFKIEGRKRSPEYAAKVVSVYRRAIDYNYEKKLTDEIKKELLEELGKVYNRGFSTGFYFGAPGENEYAGIYGSKATTRKEFVGRVTNYFKKPRVAEIKIETGVLSVGDKILFIGETTGVVELRIPNILFDDKPASKVEKGNLFTIPCEELVRPRDSVYIVRQLDKVKS